VQTPLVVPALLAEPSAGWRSKCRATLVQESDRERLVPCAPSKWNLSCSQPSIQ
jgi:hypothetical protein